MADYESSRFWHMDTEQNENNTNVINVGQGAIKRTAVVKNEIPQTFRSFSGPTMQNLASTTVRQEPNQSVSNDFIGNLIVDPSVVQQLNHYLNEPSVVQQLDNYISDPLKPMDVIIQKLNGLQINGAISTVPGPSYSRQQQCIIDELTPEYSNERIQNSPYAKVVSDTGFSLMNDRILASSTGTQYKISSSQLSDSGSYKPPFSASISRSEPKPQPVFCVYSFVNNPIECDNNLPYWCTVCSTYCPNCGQAGYHIFLCCKHMVYDTSFLKEYYNSVKNRFNLLVQIYKMKFISRAALIDQNNSSTTVDPEEVKRIDSFIKSRQRELENQISEIYRKKFLKMERVNRHFMKLIHQLYKILSEIDTNSPREIINKLLRISNKAKRLQKIFAKVQRNTCSLEMTQEHRDLLKLCEDNTEISVRRQSYDEIKYEVAQRLILSAVIRQLENLHMDQISQSVNDFVLIGRRTRLYEEVQMMPQQQSLAVPLSQQQQPLLPLQRQLLPLRHPQREILPLPQTQQLPSLPQTQQLLPQPRQQPLLHPQRQLLPQPQQHQEIEQQSQLNQVMLYSRHRNNRRSISFTNNDYVTPLQNNGNHNNFDMRIQQWSPRNSTRSYRSRNRSNRKERRQNESESNEILLALLPHYWKFYVPLGFFRETFTRVRPIPGLIFNVTVVNNSDHYPLAISPNENTPGELCRPWGICINHLNQILVTDRLHHCVKIYNSFGQYLTTFGKYGTDIGEFDRPAGITISPFGEIVIADKDNHRIQVFDSNYNLVSIFGKRGDGLGDFNYPWDVATSKTGLIGVTDSKNQRVQIFDRLGCLVYHTPKCHLIEQPRGLCFTPDDYLLVSDFNLHKILLISPYLVEPLVLGTEGTNAGQFKRPQGIICDDDGNIVIVDTNNHRVQVFDASFRFKFMISNGEGSTIGKMNKPSDVALDPFGRIVIVDFGEKIEMAPLKASPVCINNHSLF